MKHCKKHPERTIVKYYTESSRLPAEWDSFLPRSHYLHSTNLTVTEGCKLPDISYLYVAVWDNGKMILASAFQLLSLNNKHINKDMVKPYQHFLWRVFTSTIRPKLLVGGHLFRHDVASVSCAADVPFYGAYQHYMLAIEKAADISCASAVLIKDVPEKLVQYFRNYSPEYMMLRNDISMEMDIPVEWKEMADYEKALKHKYSQRYRKIRQPWEEQVLVRELTVQEVEDKKTELFELYNQVTKHQQVRIGLLNEDFIPALAKAHDNLKVWGIYKEEKLIGFFSAWLKEQAFDMFYIGFDYRLNRELNLYFNILYFSIEQAIKHKKPKLILGRTALDAKARLGCQPEYLSTFLYIKNRFIRQHIMQIQHNTDEREGAWEKRHPFGKKNN